MRLKLDKAQKIGSFTDAEKVGFFSICGGKVVGSLSRDGQRFQIRYHNTLLVEIERDRAADSWYITDGNYPSMNTANVINNFLPEGWFANFKFNYRRYSDNGQITLGRSRENERVMVTSPGGVTFNLTNLGGMTFYSDEVL